jgi:hypothetical protein
MENLGSLQSFVSDFPDRKKYSDLLQKLKKSPETPKNSSKSPNSRLSELNSRCFSRKRQNLRSSQLRTKSRLIQSRVKSRESSIGKVSPGDKLRGELM